MKPYLLVLLGILLAGCKQNPLSSIGKARAAAELHHKFLMVEFGADWCSDCRELARTLEQNRRDQIRQYVDVVKVDVGEFNRNLDVARSLHVDVNQGIPTAVFFPPAGSQPRIEVGNKQILSYLDEISESR